MDTARPGEPSWWLYRGTGDPVDGAGRDRPFPPPPPWRNFNGGPMQDPPPDDDYETHRRLGVARSTRPADVKQLDVVNAALLLRRPLLVTGRPGTGKSSLAYRIARELRLGRVLRWAITSRSTLRSGLYDYDAIGRAQAVNLFRAQPDPRLGPVAPIGDFVRLGPLGTAFLPVERPRVLLIDELDKSDIDLPNDLLNMFEDGSFTIPELTRVRGETPDVVVHIDDPGRTAVIRDGVVGCRAFPIVVLTSNGERDFPPAFLRRCLRLELPEPGAEDLAAMVAAHFGHGRDAPARTMIEEFIRRREAVGGLAADQLLNAVHLLAVQDASGVSDRRWTELLESVWRQIATVD